MADKPTTPSDGETSDASPAPEVRPNMSTQELLDAGIQVDVPYEAPPGKPERLQYSDEVSDDKGWSPPEGFTIGGVPFEEAVARIGHGGTPEMGRKHPHDAQRARDAEDTEALGGGGEREGGDAPNDSPPGPGSVA